MKYNVNALRRSVRAASDADLALFLGRALELPSVTHDFVLLLDMVLDEVRSRALARVRR